MWNSYRPVKQGARSGSEALARVRYLSAKHNLPPQEKIHIKRAPTPAEDLGWSCGQEAERLLAKLRLI
jgi:hypothetical protein